ncbi:MAG TPA: hypothetical protein VFL14_05145 [Xanthomonadales bacterium]|nr:hypothetical protein [Xanthomonadales bacterium]
MLRFCFLATLALLALAVPYTRAEGLGIRRCTAPDGGVIYTDRDCASFNATDRLPPPSLTKERYRGNAVVNDKGVVSAGTRPECPSSPGALVQSLGSAWQSHDVNRVAGLVDWRGVGSGTAHRVLGRLRTALKEEPTDIALEAPPVYEFVRDPNGGPMTVAATGSAEPTNVRVDRTGEAGWGESVRFGLRRDLDCYWLDVASLD